MWPHSCGTVCWRGSLVGKWTIQWLFSELSQHMTSYFDKVHSSFEITSEWLHALCHKLCHTCQKQTSHIHIHSVSLYIILFPCCRYDHLSRVLTKVLDERPDNVADVFEDISKDVKRSKFTSDADTVLDKVDRTTEVSLAQVQRRLFTVSSVSTETW